MWAVYVTLLIIAFLCIHYWFLEDEETDSTYHLNDLIIRPFEDEMAKYDADPDEDEYLASIRQCMYDSRKLSILARKTKAERKEDSPEEVQEISEEETSPVLSSDDENSLAIEKLVDVTETFLADDNTEANDETEEAPVQTIDDLFSVYNEENDEDESEALAEEEEILIDTWRQAIESEDNGQKLLDLLELYEDDMSDGDYEVILHALAEYAEYPTSSIAQSHQDDEVNEYRSSFEILRDVSLFDHIYHVTEEISKQFQQFPGLYQRYVGDYFLMAVYHDYGKLRKSDDGSAEQYRMLDHPVVSAEVLESRHSDVSDDVLEAIRLHHKPIDVVDTAYHKALKTADQAARQREIRQNSHQVPSLSERLPDSQFSALLYDAYKAFLDKDSSASRPSCFVAKGYLVMSRDYFFESVEKALSKIGLCQEQLISTESFHSAALTKLVSAKLVRESTVDSTIHLGVKRAGKIRSVAFQRYLAIPIESMSLRESELPDDPFGKKYTDLQFN